jgi:radical SAM protein with 4Fe4S-binding SPASM domain
MNIKQIVRSNLRESNLGRELLYQYKKLTNKIPNPDLNFPELISLEIASSCNLSCIHCPPHLKEFKDEVRKFGLMDFDLFNRLMDEIDNYGERRIALHKDGEPLLHPKIEQILERVKQNQNHKVYITTNAHYLKENVSKSILENKIDVLNFCIGAASEDFYQKVRGKNFNKVIENIKLFLELRETSSWKQKVLVQIIDLPNFPEMKNEISAFMKYWSNYDVEIQIWNQLTWGVFKNNEDNKNRYPCYSLWESTFINSDGEASVCCMDWQQKLLTGNSNQQTIKEIWQSELQYKLRQMHVDSKENEMPVCPTCNYWNWLLKLSNYMIKPD